MNVLRILVVLVAALLGGGGSAAAPDAGRAEQPCPMYTECELPRAAVAREYRHQVEFSPGQTGRPAPYTLYCHASKPLTLPGCLELEAYFDRDRDERWAPGLSVSPGGLVSGTPTRAGHWRLGLAARDANGDAGLIVGFALDVDLAIRPATLPVARVGKPYKVRFEVLGEEPPFGFAHQGGPCLRTTGLQLDARTGTLSGTPKRAGRCTLKLAVTTTLPRANVTTQKQYELTVKGEVEDPPLFALDLKGPGAVTLDVERSRSTPSGFVIRKLERATYRATVRNLTPLPQEAQLNFLFRGPLKLQYRTLDGACKPPADIDDFVPCSTGTIPPKKTASIVIAVVFSPETSRNPRSEIHEVLTAGAFRVAAHLPRDGGATETVTTKIVKK